MPTSIPAHAAPVADNKVIQFELIGDFVFSITAEISWRGKPTFETAVTDNVTGVTHATISNRYCVAKRAYKQYKRECFG